MAYWLVKTEPDSFGIDDLKKAAKKTTCWDGVRNYQARNFMRDGMRKGDYVFIYHSNCKPTGIVGLGIVAKNAYPDPSQFDEHSPYFDMKSSPEEPRWVAVDIKFQQSFKRMLTLAELKANPKLLELALVKKGSRLSVMPVSDAEAEVILAMC